MPDLHPSADGFNADGRSTGSSSSASANLGVRASPRHGAFNLAWNLDPDADIDGDGDTRVDPRVVGRPCQNRLRKGSARMMRAHFLVVLDSGQRGINDRDRRRGRRPALASPRVRVQSVQVCYGGAWKGRRINSTPSVVTQRPMNDSR